MSLPTAPGASETTIRACVRVAGVVQGVGFRPFVWRIARRMGLVGWVRNAPGGAEIEIEGERDRVERFLVALRAEAPLLSEIREVVTREEPPAGRRSFEIIETSGGGETAPSIPPDVAACVDCMREVFDPTDRRYRYPFTNCTCCGPRLSIIHGLPYDRAATTMAAFALCDLCRAEYEDPGDRRFHAQPIACPDCGPQLALLDARGGSMVAGDAALRQACRAIRAGQTVAVKGLGGYYLITDARQQRAVGELRRRKRRPSKPFAVMVRSIEEAREHCVVSEVEAATLASPRAPIVLLGRRAEADTITDSVAPGNPRLGLMLPPTPLHHLLLSELSGPVIATSGNLSDEPICFTEQDAIERLGGIADLLLVHNRPIARPVDDSIVQVCAGKPRVLRRSRGYAPESIRLPITVSSPVMAFGAHQKSTVALAFGDQVVLSQHVGDLETDTARRAHARAAADLPRMLSVRPERAARDAHPDYASTALAEASGLPLVRVGHHAAHVYAAMAEHGLGPDRDVIGVAWDGTGFGADGTIWGGEFLRVRGARVERIARLRPFPLPGASGAARCPARSGIGALFEAMGAIALRQRDLASVRHHSEGELALLGSLLARGFNCPITSSAGRLFDAAASVLGLCQVLSYEGEGAAMLQFAAEAGVQSDPLPIAFGGDGLRELDWRAAMRTVVERLRSGGNRADIALAFHDMLARGIARVLVSLGAGDADAVVLTGGCFQNALLAELCVEHLEAEGITGLLHERIPPNDGGIALGQAYAAALAEGVD